MRGTKDGGDGRTDVGLLAKKGPRAKDDDEDEKERED